MCVFVSRTIENSLFHRKNDHPKWVVDFLRERDTLLWVHMAWRAVRALFCAVAQRSSHVIWQKEGTCAHFSICACHPWLRIAQSRLRIVTHTFRKIMEIFKDFVEKSYNNNGNPWKSQKILRVKTKPLEIFWDFTFVFCIFSFSIFSSFSIFIHFSAFFFIFLHFSSFFFIFLHFSLFFFIFYILRVEIERICDMRWPWWRLFTTLTQSSWDNQTVKLRIRWRVQRLINICAEWVHQQYTHPDVPAMASASWLEALSLSKPPLASTLPPSELCTSSDERSQFRQSRDTISTVSPPPCHIELFPHRDWKLYHDPNRWRPEGDPPHPAIVPNSTSFSLPARNSYTSLLFPFCLPISCPSWSYNLAFQFVSNSQLPTLDWYQ